ncbi:hypothetical protein [Sedimentitalea nanhaiensis]|uniref:UrcA family protein n=1 Tax=Sedimentitalea nanhaiensis TaxID=999627 RepID=A0A1I7C051_9RHOB|nr:hypothetical protein [Sedimentitalea nanhaiensis]SFT92806.1 hypothetical protein SAMN05216236_11368 [Sedimentitalea nanhaiensis]
MKIVLHGLCIAVAAGSLSLSGGAVSAQALYTVILPAGEFGSKNYTEVVTSNIAAAQAFCAEIDNDSYKVDCLAERLGEIAKEIPKDSDYAEVRQILADTSKQLSDLAKANRDPNQVRGRAVSKGEIPVSTSRPLNPVKPSSLPDVNRQARAILDNTQTLLLRSAESSESKALQYSRIADALGSSKVLLRSA